MRLLLCADGGKREELQSIYLGLRTRSSWLRFADLYPIMMVTCNMRDIEKIKTITVRGKRYNFVVKKLRVARGMTEHPLTKNKTVYIDARERGKELLATLIDELIHCAVWELENSVVDDISDDMANILWRCGLRFKDDLSSDDTQV